jgi:flagella basal body P-ring formation protein FlgA
MTRTLAHVFALLAVVLAATPAAAQTLAALSDTQQPRPALRTSAIVTDDVVRIGDLIDNAGIVADVPIFRAPDPGTTGRVSAARVIEAVEAHALVGLSAKGIREISVTRPGRQVASGAIEAGVAAALATRYGLGDAKDIEVRFDMPPSPVNIDANASGTVGVEQLTYLARSGRFEAIVEVAGNDTRRMRLSGTALATAEVVTVNRALSRGALVRTSDIAIERRPRVQITPDMLTDPAQAVGRAARNTINAGRPLRGTDLTKPHLVQRNDFVTLIYEVPGITLTMRGKANEPGTEGDVVEVLNMQSKRLVHGVVTGQGRVVVSAITGPAIVASNAAPDRAPSSKSTSAAVRAQ